MCVSLRASLRNKLALRMVKLFDGIEKTTSFDFPIVSMTSSAVRTALSGRTFADVYRGFKQRGTLQ